MAKRATTLWCSTTPLLHLQEKKQNAAPSSTCQQLDTRHQSSASKLLCPTFYRVHVSMARDQAHPVGSGYTRCPYMEIQGKWRIFCFVGLPRPVHRRKLVQSKGDRGDPIPPCPPPCPERREDHNTLFHLQGKLVLAAPTPGSMHVVLSNSATVFDQVSKGFFGWKVRLCDYLMDNNYSIKMDASAQSSVTTTYYIGVWTAWTLWTERSMAPKLE
jgi:hypothetical protein